MNITFGVHKNKTVERVVLQRADYVRWLIETSELTGPAKKLADHVRTVMIAKFDRRPVTSKCTRCQKPGTRLTAYRGNTDIYAWCDDCDPASLAAEPTKLSNVTTYRRALEHVERTCKKRKGDDVSIIKKIARAKGAPDRLTEQEALAFFSAAP